MVISVCKWYNVKKRTVTSEESRKGRGHMNKLEDMIAASKLNELLHKKVYKFFTPDYLEDFEEDFEDDFDDDFFSDDDEV